MKSVLRSLGLLIAVGSLVACAPTPPPTPAAGADVPDDGRDQTTVVRVVDGDTLVAALGGIDTTVRLLNVDTPETKDPNKAVECLGPEASEFLNKLLPVGTPVELEYDGDRLDRYGRTLAGVWLGDALVNAEVARAGFGTPVEFNGQVKFLPPVEQAATEAEEAEAGAFADNVPCALPDQVDDALSAMERVNDPAQQTTASYAAVIASLTSARKTAREVASLTKTARRTTGAAAWVFHDAVRSSQRTRIESGINDADERLDELQAGLKTVKKKEASELKRKLEREKAQREEAQREKDQRKRAAERRRSAEAERLRQQRAADRARESSRRDDSGSSGGSRSSGGGSGLEGYNGPRCYAPGGKSWRPC